MLHQATKYSIISRHLKSTKTILADNLQSELPVVLGWLMPKLPFTIRLTIRKIYHKQVLCSFLKSPDGSLGEAIWWMV
jgi:hypothetical protein